MNHYSEAQREKGGRNINKHMVTTRVRQPVSVMPLTSNAQLTCVACKTMIKTFGHKCHTDFGKFLVFYELGSSTNQNIYKWSQ